MMNHYEFGILMDC